MAYGRGAPGAGAGDALASEFASLVNRLDLQADVKPQRPSHLMAPTAAVAAQMAALQRPDWPEAGAGALTAYLFAMPQGYGGAAAPRSDPRKQSGVGEGAAPAFPTAPVPESTPRRSWGAKDEWLSLDEFKRRLAAPPYDVILGCDSWRPAGPLVFPGSRQGARAVQSVEVTAARRPAAGGAAAGAAAQGDGGGGGGAGGGAERAYTFTFCLERVEGGSMKGCWLTVGVRVGDYSL
ncbi:MAG: hypothetical protein J3K34DRAFT_519826 [Monoraphidium minutum]|nr:MAG: hypothetical protein J3K34DRAFT_519826 [Monoraphidium minutum]